MRHLVFEEPGRVAFQDADEPALPDGAAAIVRPLAIARCDLDPIMAATGAFPGPFPVGHETVAEVVSAGDEVEGHRPGDRVVVPFQVSCGACVACRGGRFAACHTYRAKAGAAFGFGQAGGGHGGAVADRLVVPHADHMLEPAPAGLRPEQLCTLPDNVVDAYRTVGPPLAASPGAEVLVVGGAAPSIGLYAVALASALGAARVRYVDGDAARLAVAERLGAEAIEHAGEWPRRFERAPITVENTGSPEGLTCTIRSTDDYGVCTPVAIHFAPATPVPLLEMYTKGITLVVGRADSRRFLSDVVALAADGRFDPLAVDTTIVPFDDAADAWMAPATKLVVVADQA